MNNYAGGEEPMVGDTVIQICKATIEKYNFSGKQIVVATQEGYSGLTFKSCNHGNFGANPRRFKLIARSLAKKLDKILEE